MIINMEKLKKCASQIFDFEIMKIANFQGHFPPDTVGYGKPKICHDYKHGKMKKCTSLIFNF